MDPALATLVLSSVNKAVGAASDEAGRQVWQGLVALIRRARRQPEAGVEPARPETLAGVLIEAASCDPQFAAELRAWIELAARLGAPADESVTNTIGQQARIAGDVVQARDVEGSITFR